MSIVLARIDDRLIHGQVVESWLPVLGADAVLVISDEAAADPTQRALMRLALPDSVELEICPVREGAAAALRAASDERKVLILAPGPAEALALLDGGLRLEAVNVGGLHFAAGRVRLGKAIYLSEADVRALAAIVLKGVRLEGRAVPFEKPTDVGELLKDKA